MNRKIKNIRVRIAAVILFGVLYGCFGWQGGQALAAKSTVHIPTDAVTSHHNGGEVTIKRPRQNQLKISFDTKGEQKGYYTASFYAEKYISVGKNQVLSFYIKTKQKIRLNGNVVLAPGYESYSCKEGSKVYLKRDKSSKYEICLIENGTFEIPEKFSGEVLLFADREPSSMEIYGTGIFAVLAENERADFSIANIRIKDESCLQEDIYHTSFRIEGEQYPQIPMEGEYYYTYRPKFTEGKVPKDKIEFYLESEVKGIRLDKSGRLYIQSDVKPQTIRIRMEMDRKLLYHFEVNVSYSWLAKAEGIDTSSFIVPATKDVKQEHARIEIPYSFIRRAFVLSVLVFLIFYVREVKGKEW